jgi:hypothetical protein
MFPFLALSIAAHRSRNLGELGNHILSFGDCSHDVVVDGDA